MAKQPQQVAPGQQAVALTPEQQQVADHLGAANAQVSQAIQAGLLAGLPWAEIINAIITKGLPFLLELIAKKGSAPKP